MKKLIVTDGCSFTNWRTTWASKLSEKFIAPVINLGVSGNSNDRIVGQFIDRLVPQLALNPDTEKVAIVIQLTGLDRKLVDGEISPTVGKVLGETKHKASIFNLFGMVNLDWGFGRKSKVDWENYFANEWSPEKHINDLLEGIIKLQEGIRLLNKHGFQIEGQDKIYKPSIDHRIICGWDILTSSENMQWSLTDPHNNIDAKLVKDEFESSQELWEKINWNKFWFCENETCKYGGITEWVQYNMDPIDWYQGVNCEEGCTPNPDDRHPTFQAHEKI